MDTKTKQAFEWALNQNHRSVAADYARKLAQYIEAIGDIEADYPNWHGKFACIADAVRHHTSAQNGVIANLLSRVSSYRGEDMIGDDGFGTTEHALKSARDALWTIANMQITENTDKSEVLEACMSTARFELEKCSTAGK